MNKVSLRLRITLISVSLLLVCCLGLTAVLNHAADDMADTIEAVTVVPAMTTDNAKRSDLDVALSDLEEAVPLVASMASQEARALFSLQSWLWMLLIVAVGGLATWFITGKALQPLRELSAEMETRTVETLSQELPIPASQDEIASLTKSFNSMSQKLGESFSMQKRFAQSAAHELRTPLTVLKAKVDVFGKRSTHTDAEYKELLRLVSSQTERMIALVQDLLGLTNLDELTCTQSITLQPILAEAVKELMPLAAERNVSLALHAEDCTVVGNVNLLHQVFVNLVENAVKYNVSGGAVTVTAVREGNQAIIRVADTGVGIPDDQKAFIFEPFYRIDKSRSRQMGGAGLGLATVKAIVDKHGGTITVTDGADGGSIFTVCLQSI